MYLAAVYLGDMHLNSAQLITSSTVPVSPVVFIFVENDRLKVASVAVSMSRLLLNSLGRVCTSRFVVPGQWWKEY